MDTKIIIKVIIGIVSFIIILISTTIFFSNSEFYYEDAAYDDLKLPSGINEIQSLDGNRRYYKIVKYGGRILSLSFHDYDGTLRPMPSADKNAAKYEYFYNDDDQLIKIVKSDSDSKVVKTEIIKPAKKKQKK